MEISPKEIILWLDETILVVDKPAGLLTLPDGYEPSRPHLRSILEPEFDRLWIVHRLDRQTSGVILLARNASTHRNLNTQFQERRVEKVYHALVAGNPPWLTRTISLPLRPDGDRRHRTVVDHRKGKSATTSLRLLENYPAYALIEARPTTGRPHQIRAHLAAAGYPLIADHLYGSRSHPSHALLGRLGLHARSLSIHHPTSGELLTFSSPYPDDLAALLSSRSPRNQS